METQSQSLDGQERMKKVREVLTRHERYRVLELYFCREGGRLPDYIPAERKELLDITQDEMKEFLLGQFPQDPLLHKFLRIIQ
jgi:hypothetical protein